MADTLAALVRFGMSIPIKARFLADRARCDEARSRSWFAALGYFAGLAAPGAILADRA